MEDNSIKEDVQKVISIENEKDLSKPEPLNNTLEETSDKDTVTSVTNDQFSGDHKYELIDGSYYFTDETSQQRYKYTDNDWIAVSSERVDASGEDTSNVHVDEEGRTYYYSKDRYLCRYPTGHVYYMDDKNEWVLWNTEENTDGSCTNTGTQQSDDSKWYFYKGDDAFYRDQSTNVIYKLNKASNEWEKYKGGKRKKKLQPRGTQDEEFDTESSNEDEMDDTAEADDALGSSTAPPGYKNDPNISYDGTSYTKVDNKDSMTYEWDTNRRAWFPKVMIIIVHLFLLYNIMFSY